MATIAEHGFSRREQRGKQVVQRAYSLMQNDLPAGVVSVGVEAHCDSVPSLSFVADKGF